MKKVAVLTLNGNYNYGNKLQNYALVTIINKLNFRCDNIWIDDKHKTKRIKNFIKGFFFWDKDKIRKNNIRKFDNKYIKSKYFSNVENIKNKYDYYITGSDQVWNYNFKTFSQRYLLTFSQDKQKNISYAASFGVDAIDKKYKKLFKNAINTIGYISVRENKAKELIKELGIDTEVQVVIDPTMLLDIKEWNKMVKKPQKYLDEEKYILLYFLGEISSERMAEIQRIAKENKYKIIDILNPSDVFYTNDPGEFIYLEKNASLICTDSFHSCVFAILFEVPFIVFEREDSEENMSSRLDTLLSKFKLQDRKFNGKISEDLLKCDYSNAKKILKEEKEKSMQFLRKALQINE